MKNIILFTVFIYSWSLLKPLMLVIDYEVNKAQITTDFCVNNNNPQSHCNGKCYLSKNLKENQDSDSNSPLNNKKQKIDHKKSVDFCPTDLTQAQFHFELLKKHHFYYSLSQDQYLLKIDSPPPKA